MFLWLLRTRIAIDSFDMGVIAINTQVTTSYVKRLPCPSERSTSIERCKKKLSQKRHANERHEVCCDNAFEGFYFPAYRYVFGVFACMCLVSYQDGSPVYGGANDPRMGTLDFNTRCRTCDCTYTGIGGNQVNDCPGHFGHMEVSCVVLEIDGDASVGGGWQA